MSTLEDAPAATAPPREQWPVPPPHSEAGALLTEVIIATFRLNGRLMDVAQDLAAQGGLTAAWWQVLGGVLDQPRTVAEIGRRMGMTRQGVQRVADLLVQHGLAEYRSNPNHRRAKLLACTEAGYWAVRQITVLQHPWANRVGAEIGPAELRGALAAMQRLITALETDQADQQPPSPTRETRRPRPPTPSPLTATAWPVR